jgi:hypothetical protein
MPLTATVLPDEAAVLLDINFSTVPDVQITATVQRHFVRDGILVDEFVRGGNFLLLLNGNGKLYDFEAPLDVDVYYTSLGYPTDDASGPSNADEQVSATVVIPGGGFVWFKDPGRPWANIAVDLCADDSTPQDGSCAVQPGVSLVSFGDDERSADAGIFDVLNRERPIDIYARRKDVVHNAISFASRTCDAIDDVYTLFTAGGPLFIQAPEVYCWPDRYVQPMDLKMDIISRDQRKPWRLWTVPLIVVDQPAPGAPSQGTVCTNWCAIEQMYPTFADLTATGLNWGDVLEGEATVDCPDSSGGAGGGSLLGYGEGGYGENGYGGVV